MTEPIAHLMKIAEEKSKLDKAYWSQVDARIVPDDDTLAKIHAYTFALKQVAEYVRALRVVDKSGFRCCPFCGSELASIMKRWMCSNGECILSRTDFDKADMRKWNSRDGEITETQIAELLGETNTDKEEG